MKRFTTNEEMETLCEALIRDWFRCRRSVDALCVDIEGFVREYLGLPVVFEAFAESDPGRLGFLSDGRRVLAVFRDGRRKEIVFPRGTAVIERFLLEPGEQARKRFTLAHEGAHEILNRHIPIQASPLAAFHSEVDSGFRYLREVLKEMMSYNEVLANRAAAGLLMPRFLTERVLAKHNGSRKVILYAGEDGTVLSQDQKLLIQKMADVMGVSYSALFYRLKELDLFETRPVEEYLRAKLRCGGDYCAGKQKSTGC